MNIRDHQRSSPTSLSVHNFRSQQTLLCPTDPISTFSFVVIIMKLVLSTLALACATASAFVPSSTQFVSTKLSASTTGGNFRPNDWTGYPADTARKSSTPVPARKVSKSDRAKMDDVMLDPNYFLTFAVAALGPLIMWYHPSYTADGTPSLIGIMGGGFHILFAALLWVQTRRVRCVFEKDSFEFYNIKGPQLDLENGAWLQRKPDNYVAGTVNRWKYDSIINYGFFPSETFPVICYFKETETPEWKWNRWFAAFDSYGRGQPHFFPGICSVQQFKEQMELRGAKRKPIPTMGASKKFQKK